MKLSSFLFLIIIPANCFSQKENWIRDHQPGCQLGYYYSKINTIDAGVNYYWSINACSGSGPEKWACHTFGPFACADLNFINKTCYVGERGGFNYHVMYGSFFAYTISPAIEHIAKNDLRLGADIGVSFLGLLLYYGYYTPIGQEQIEGASVHRVGIRLVFNMAPVNTNPFD